MKTLLNTLIFLMITTFCFSQSDIVSIQTDDSKITKSIENSKKETAQSSILKEKYGFMHSKQAVDQLRLYLAKNVKYPKSMAKNSKEGKIVLEVHISVDGEIVESTVFRGLSKEFDQAALEAMKTLKKIELKELNYFGNTKVYVPVEFTLTDF